MGKSLISNAELDLLLESHRKYLLGEKDGILLELENRIIRGYDFSGKDCENAQFLSCAFEYEFEGEEGYDPESGESYYMKPNGTKSFVYTNFTNVNFTGTTFNGIFDFDTTRLNNAIFINVDWNKLQLNSSQKSVIITTVSQLTNKIKTQDNVIGEKDQKIEVKNFQLEKTSERESKGMLDIFDELKLDFGYEERLWIIFGFYIFLVLFAIASAIFSLLSPIISAYANIVLVVVILFIIWNFNTEKQKRDNKDFSDSVIVILIMISTFLPVIYFVHEAFILLIGGTSTWIKVINSDIGLNQLKNIAPLTLILFTILWFSVHQYGRAKKLRIEQQNKQAMIHFMQAVIASDGKASKENQTFPMLAPFFANAIIHRPFSQENYEPQLPMDKLFQMAKDTKDIIK